MRNINLYGIGEGDLGRLAHWSHRLAEVLDPDVVRTILRLYIADLLGQRRLRRVRLPRRRAKA